MEEDEFSQLTTLNCNGTTTLNKIQGATSNTPRNITGTITSTTCDTKPTPSSDALDADLSPIPDIKVNSNSTTLKHAEPDPDPSSINPTILLNHIFKPLIKEV